MILYQCQVRAPGAVLRKSVKSCAGHVLEHKVQKVQGNQITVMRPWWRSGTSGGLETDQPAICPPRFNERPRNLTVRRPSIYCRRPRASPLPFSNSSCSCSGASGRCAGLAPTNPCRWLLLLGSSSASLPRCRQLTRSLVPRHRTQTSPA